MKCEKCDLEYDDTLATCPNCSSTEMEAVSLNPAADKVLGMLKDNLFLVICVLVSGASVFSLATGGIPCGIPLLHILMSVFLWLAFAQSKKGFADGGHLRCVSGTLYANYVIVNVSTILIIVSGALLGFAWQVVSNMDIMQEIMDEVIGIVGMEYTYMVESLFSISGYLIIGIFVGIGLVGLLINVLGFNREVAKAMIIDSARAWNEAPTPEEVALYGHGVVPIKIEDIVRTKDDEIKFVVTDISEKWNTYNYDFPIPMQDDKYPYVARATMCYFPICDRTQGVD